MTYCKNPFTIDCLVFLGFLEASYCIICDVISSTNAPALLQVFTSFLPKTMFF